GRLTMTKVVSLCPACSNRPTVELRDSEVYIGEGANLVKLRVEEWNTLVRAVKSGALDEVDAQST
ncbi:MAG TPA: hypothetical protein VNB49_18815, partial [Candidatus Dormibacteraeota bacterium]|nr:hypothetical protein [Candidatus Dormibacteraeota bacterium]